MSVKNGKDFLYLIWKSEKSRKQYVVGQLTRNGQYEFRYCKEVKDAIADGFKLLLCFQELDRVYKDEKLFSVFASRLPDKKRRDMKEILQKYGLNEYDEYMLLKRSGARLPIDSLEFIDPILDTDGNVTRIFFMAGVRHYLGCGGNACEDAVKVTRGDEVLLKRKLDNSYDLYAVQLLDVSKNVLGYIPGYYAQGVSELMQVGRKMTCHIYNVDRDKNCNECIKVIMKV